VLRSRSVEQENKFAVIEVPRLEWPATLEVPSTTWHDDETLEETLDFLATSAWPTDGFAPDSDFRLVISVANQQWAAQAQKFLESVQFFL
jgi:hypothetical protein